MKDTILDVDGLMQLNINSDKVLQVPKVFAEIKKRVFDMKTRLSLNDPEVYERYKTEIDILYECVKKLDHFYITISVLEQ